MTLRKYASRFFYSFPVQLVVMHLKKNQIMVLYWVLLFGFITETIARRFGIPFLFLGPEYMGQVGPLSFLIIGLCLGAFIMAFNISSFILNSFRFPFLATLSRTFVKFSLNNFIIPIVFIGSYIWRICEFQSESDLRSMGDISLNIASLLSGILIVVFITIRYFMFTNKDIYKLFGVAHADDDVRSPIVSGGSAARKKTWRVDTYLASPVKIKRVRDTRHYKRYMLERVFRQNHVNAAVVEIVVFVIFILLGLFRDYTIFRIPAGASVLLLLTMFIMLSGVFRYWLRAWANSALILLFLLLNFLSHFEAFNPRNQAYGIDYTKSKATVSRASLEAQVADSIRTADILHTTEILNRWKLKQKEEKPKLVLLSVSGGGLRSCVFTFRTLQVIDSILGGNLMHKTAFATGSSGGMISLCYYRELYLNHRDSLLSGHTDIRNRYLRNTGKDLLNSIAFSATIADLFLNYERFRDGTNYYIKDRAWAWETQLLENTEGVLDKRLRDYSLPESMAEIPLVVISPTIINDGRALHIAAQPSSWLLHEPDTSPGGINAVVNGVEFSRFFREYNPGNLKLSSALRMNSAFPYVMPAVSLPSEPTLEVMDAGIRDNYGIMNNVQFLHTFKDWIAENTSGVVLIQIRDTYKHLKVEDNSIKTMLEKLLAPMRNLSGNFLVMQDYNFDQYLEFAKSFTKVPLHQVVFQMPQTDDKVSLSWHLTEKEKKLLSEAALNMENRQSLRRLLRLIIPDFNTQPALAGPVRNDHEVESSIPVH